MISLFDFVNERCQMLELTKVLDISCEYTVYWLPFHCLPLTLPTTLSRTPLNAAEVLAPTCVIIPLLDFKSSATSLLVLAAVGLVPFDSSLTSHVDLCSIVAVFWIAFNAAGLGRGGGTGGSELACGFGNESKREDDLPALLTPMLTTLSRAFVMEGFGGKGGGCGRFFTG